MNNEESRVVVVAVMPWFCLISTLELWAREHAGILTTQEHDEVIPLDRALGANNMIGSDSPLAHWERTHVLGSWKKSSGLAVKSQNDEEFVFWPWLNLSEEWFLNI